MCGIIGYSGPQKACPIILEGLKRLEYRGYDSAGIAVGNDGTMSVVKATGKLKKLLAAIPAQGIEGNWGIGHTRWATHGGITETNAHPQMDSKNEIAVVHNGIIENYRDLRERLKAEGFVFKSETDTEVIPHLIAHYYKGNLEEAVLKATCDIEGTYGIAVMHIKEPGRIVAARNGSPLVIGIGDGEMLIASDILGFISSTSRVVHLVDGDLASFDHSNFHIIDKNATRVLRTPGAVESHDFAWSDKAGFAHFMEKEICEQPESIGRAIAGRIDVAQASSKLGGLNLELKHQAAISRIGFIAAGTSWHASLVGAHLLERIARIPSQAYIASELRYSNPIVHKDSLWFAVSQSGETADTIYAMHEIKRKGGTVLGICNVIGSTIARDSDGGIYVHSGPEISVASTKAFTSQLAAMYLFAIHMARMRDLSLSEGKKLIANLERVPDSVTKILKSRDQIRALSAKYCNSKNFLFLGRGLLYPIALEGALKLKEISYIHAEGYPAGELKHGPIALVNEETPTVILVPDDSLREKSISNIKQIKARGGKVIAIGADTDTELPTMVDDFIAVPHSDSKFYPFTMVVPLQLFAYYCAAKLGRDVDQPRNLAKSVTVE